MLKSIILLLVAIIPVFVIGLFIYRRDNEREPFKLLFKLFILGALACFPAAIFEEIVSLFFGDIDNMTLPLLFIYVSIGIGFVEELVKWIIVYKKGYNSREFDHIYDALVYCAFVSLGFACLENLFYVFADTDIVVGLLRGITAIPGHVCNAIVMGDYLGTAKTYQLHNDIKKEKKYLILSIVLPTFTHTIYDYCIYSNKSILIVWFAIFLVSIGSFSYFRIKKLSNVNDKLINNKNDNNM